MTKPKPPQRRRPRGTGSVYKRAVDGRWVADVPLGTIILPNGKRKRDHHPEYYKTEREAEAARKRMVYERDQGKTPHAGHMTVEQYLHYWLQGSAQINLSPRTLEHYESRIRVHLIPALGTYTLDKLGPEHIQRMINDKLKAGYKPSTLATIRNCLSAALQQAVKWRWLTYNAARLADIPRTKGEAAGTKQYLEQDEVAALLEASKGTRYEALYWLACSTGMRIGEMLGLKWSDVDLDAHTLQIRRQWQAVNGKHQYTPPKTKKSEGLIYLPPVCIPILKVYRARQREERIATGPKWKDMDAVFTNTVGTPMYRDRINRHLRTILPKLGIHKHITIHCLRHTYATMLFAENTDLKTVSEMLRHTTVSTTAGVYVHVIPRLKSQAVSKINRLLGGT